ncbi:unnamed protein product [Chironomus riparius]|uniref:Uncharacterized protein n=1 Tax=Chironomus riparius TaxID=315576 RepID=A0A9N9S564_9DIPT|nr:unnamed protein product [Chironomus riparius]
MMFLIALAVLVVILFITFFFLRTQKDMPKNWEEFVIEFKMQAGGTQALIEDTFLRYKNKVDLVQKPNKIAIMTGGNRGIGVHTLEKLLKCSMTVMLGVRSPEASKKSIEKALGTELTKDKVFYEKCDTGDMKSVRDFAKKVQEKYSAIHLLINNAGVMFTPFNITADGFESQMAINHMGHFLLTHLLMPQLIAGSNDNDGKNVRIVNVSSCVHKRCVINYDDFDCKKFYYPADAYNKSKLAQVLFTKHLQVLLSQNGLKMQTNSLHPGVVDTDLFANSSTDYIPWFRTIMFKTPEEGSRTIIYASISPKLEGKGGLYLSNCTIMPPNDVANNPQECKKLFDYCCKLLKIENFGNLN